jgi:hypothetical protein
MDPGIYTFFFWLVLLFQMSIEKCALIFIVLLFFPLLSPRFPPTFSKTAFNTLVLNAQTYFSSF